MWFLFDGVQFTLWVPVGPVSASSGARGHFPHPVRGSCPPQLEEKIGHFQQFFGFLSPRCLPQKKFWYHHWAGLYTNHPFSSYYRLESQVFIIGLSLKSRLLSFVHKNKRIVNLLSVETYVGMVWINIRGVVWINIRGGGAREESLIKMS